METDSDNCLNMSVLQRFRKCTLLRGEQTEQGVQSACALLQALNNIELDGRR